jgi:hypothetical protein
MAMSADVTYLSPGRVIAGYRIEGVAGRGGMGVVYRATQLTLDRIVALKVIAPELARDEGFRQRFKRESRVAASIRHPNVIAVHDALEAEGFLFITMDFIEGHDLAELISRERRVAPERAAEVVGKVADALDAAHSRGLVHRDVKPANVLVSQEDRGEQVYLTDFGLTKHAASMSGLTETGMFVGTVDYVAPEQIEGVRLDARADVYALGCVLFHALTGQVPYPRDSPLAKLYAHTHLPPPSLLDIAPDAPPLLDKVIRRAMATDRDERYLSAGDLGRAAVSAVAGREVSQPERSVATGAATLDRDDAEVQPDATTADLQPAATAASPERATTASARPAATRLAPAPQRRRLWVGGAIAAIAAVVVVLALSLSTGGSDGGTGSGTKSAQPDAGPQPLNVSPSLPSGYVSLSPLGGQTLSGDPACTFEQADSLISSIELKCSDVPDDAAHTGYVGTGSTASHSTGCVPTDPGYTCTYSDEDWEVSVPAPTIDQARARLIAVADAVSAVEGSDPLAEP